MTLLAQLAALLAIISTGVVYGTDAFCALVQRPALARVDDATLTPSWAMCTATATGGCPPPGSSASSPPPPHQSLPAWPAILQNQWPCAVAKSASRGRHTVVHVGEHGRPTPWPVSLRRGLGATPVSNAP